MDFIYNLVQLIRFSPKRLSLFDSLRKDIALQTGDVTPSLRVLCPTRWTVRHTSINSIVQNYQVLKTALEEIQQGRNEYAAKASGLLIRMENFDTLFSLKLSYLVYSSAEQLSTNLQAKDITIQEAVKKAKLLTSHLKSLRNKAKFDHFYDGVYQDSESLTNEPCLPRNRKAPRRYDGESSHQYDDPNARCRHAYFEIHELAAGEVEKRFDQKDLQIINQIKQLLLKAGNGEAVDSLSPIVYSYWKNDVDQDRLKVQRYD